MTSSQSTTLDSFNQEVLAAHEKGDGRRLSDLYTRAGQQMIDDGQIAEGCFFLTQGYVFALEEGMDSAAGIHATLVRLGYDR